MRLVDCWFTEIISPLLEKLINDQDNLFVVTYVSIFIGLRLQFWIYTTQQKSALNSVWIAGGLGVEPLVILVNQCTLVGSWDIVGCQPPQLFLDNSNTGAKQCVPQLSGTTVYGAKIWSLEMWLERERSSKLTQSCEQNWCILCTQQWRRLP